MSTSVWGRISTGIIFSVFSVGVMVRVYVQFCNTAGNWWEVVDSSIELVSENSIGKTGGESGDECSTVREDWLPVCLDWGGDGIGLLIS